MRIEELNVYLHDVDIDDVVPEEAIRRAIAEAVNDAVVRRVRRFTEDTVDATLMEVKGRLTERINARVGPRLDAIFQEVVERLDHMTDEQLLEDVF